MEAMTFLLDDLPWVGAPTCSWRLQATGAQDSGPLALACPLCWGLVVCSRSPGLVLWPWSSSVSVTLPLFGTLPTVLLIGI